MPRPDDEPTDEELLESLDRSMRDEEPKPQRDSDDS